MSKIDKERISERDICTRFITPALTRAKWYQMSDETLIPLHGGYRKLKSFRVAQLAYDVTVRFCDRYVEKRSRTHDQMVQAARSGVQNIAEGSQASGTSKKMELKLTNVARASLEELRLDYEDFLRQRGLEQWQPGHPALMRYLACYLLDRQLAALEKAFIEEGGFTERLYRVRAQARQRPSAKSLSMNHL